LGRFSIDLHDKMGPQPERSRIHQWPVVDAELEVPRTFRQKGFVGWIQNGQLGLPFRQGLQ
jgi:hypothetical protein